MRRKGFIIVGAAAGVLLLLLIAVPYLINVDHYRANIESAASSSLGRQVQVGNLHLSLLRRTLTARDISIADDEAFSRSPFLQAKSMAVGVEVLPLLFSHRLHVTSLTLAEPQLNLLRSPSGKWNLASLGVHEKSGTPAAPSSDSMSALQGYSVQKLKITNGRVSVGTVASGHEQSYEDVNLTAKDISTASAFPVAMDVKTSGAGRITLAGTVGPIDPNRTMEQVMIHLKFRGQNMPVQGMEGLLHTLNISLPSGASLQSGSMNAELTVDGLLGRLVTAGPVALSGVNVSGFNLASWVGAMAAMSGLASSPNTLIQSMSCEMRAAPEEIQLNNLNMVLPDFGTLTGAGTISPSDVLNFRMLAKLNGGRTPLGGLRTIASLGQGSPPLPFRIQGTTSLPIFIPDFGGAVGNTVALPFRGVGRIFGKLTGEKKP